MDFETLRTEDMRLVILRLLCMDPGRDLNEHLLRAAMATYGHEPSRDRLRSEVAWLEEQGLVTTRRVESLLIVKLTVRGEDVAHGRSTVPGVKRPCLEDMA